MATLTIGLAGSAIVTGSKSYTVNDTDIQALLDWATVAYDPYIQATFNAAKNPNFVPTNQQVLLAWVQSWINGTKDAVQRFKTAVPTPPPPISIT